MKVRIGISTTDKLLELEVDDPAVFKEELERAVADGGLGLPPKVVQERLGHEDYTTTRRVYGHLLPDMHVEAGLAASRAFAATTLRAVEE